MVVFPDKPSILKVIFTVLYLYKQTADKYCYRNFKHSLACTAINSTTAHGSATLCFYYCRNVHFYYCRNVSNHSISMWYSSFIISWIYFVEFLVKQLVFTLYKRLYKEIKLRKFFRSLCVGKFHVISNSKMVLFQTTFWKMLFFNIIQKKHQSLRQGSI